MSKMTMASVSAEIPTGQARAEHPAHQRSHIPNPAPRCLKPWSKVYVLIVRKGKSLSPILQHQFWGLVVCFLIMFFPPLSKFSRAARIPENTHTGNNMASLLFSNNH